MPVQTPGSNPGPNSGAQPAQADMSAVRIDVKRLAWLLFYVLLLPGSLAIALDFLLGFFPLLTLVTVVVVIPAAGFLVMRSTLREIKSVIDQVAPEEEPEEETPENEVPESFEQKIESEK